MRTWRVSVFIPLDYQIPKICYSKVRNVGFSIRIHEPVVGSQAEGDILSPGIFESSVSCRLISDPQEL